MQQLTLSQAVKSDLTISTPFPTAKQPGPEANLRRWEPQGHELKLLLEVLLIGFQVVYHTRRGNKLIFKRFNLKSAFFQFVLKPLHNHLMRGCLLSCCRFCYFGLC